ncbi:MAG: DUF5661 family protein [Promethearchaeota archaeon]
MPKPKHRRNPKYNGRNFSQVKKGSKITKRQTIRMRKVQIIENGRKVSVDRLCVVYKDPHGNTRVHVLEDWRLADIVSAAQAEKHFKSLPKKRQEADKKRESKYLYSKNNIKSSYLTKTGVSSSDVEGIDTPERKWKQDWEKAGEIQEEYDQAAIQQEIRLVVKEITQLEHRMNEPGRTEQEKKDFQQKIRGLEQRLTYLNTIRSIDAESKKQEEISKSPLNPNLYSNVDEFIKANVYSQEFEKGQVMTSSGWNTRYEKLYIFGGVGYKTKQEAIDKAKKFYESKEILKGGHADKLPDSDFDKEELAKGTRIEMEHTNDAKIAKEIAKDHLSESPEYYKELEKMEEKLEKDQKIIQTLEVAGGNHWQKYGKNRVYFDAPHLAKEMGYEWSNYKTGNISSATYKGEKISNSEMRRVLNDLDCKLYYDLDDDKFHYQSGVGTGGDHTDDAIKHLRTKIDKK